MRIGAVIVAAGLSSRMGEFKPMLCLGSDTVIERTIAALKNAGAYPIVVVTGYKAEYLEKSLSNADVNFARNKDFANTQMFDSICVGLRAVPQDCDGVFIIPSDVPLVESATFDALLQKWGEADVIRPNFNGYGGHPLLVASTVIPRLLQYNGEGGLRGAVAGLRLRTVDVSVSDEGVILDADTPEDYKKLLKLDALRSGHGFLRMDMRLNLASDDVFLTPEIAQLLEMTEHTGSLRTACACVHISYSKGWKTINRIESLLGFKILDTHSGGNAGGGSSLTSRGKNILKAYQKFTAETREYALLSFRKHFPPEILR